MMDFFKIMRAKFEMHKKPNSDIDKIIIIASEYINFM